MENRSTGNFQSISYHLGKAAPHKRRDPLLATGWPVPCGGKTPAGSAVSSRV